MAVGSGEELTVKMAGDMGQALVSRSLQERELRAGRSSVLVHWRITDLRMQSILLKAVKFSFLLPLLLILLLLLQLLLQ